METSANYKIVDASVEIIDLEYFLLVWIEAVDTEKILLSIQRCDHHLPNDVKQDLQDFNGHSFQSRVVHDANSKTTCYKLEVTESFFEYANTGDVDLYLRIHVGGITSKDENRAVVKLSDGKFVSARVLD